MSRPENAVPPAVLNLDEALGLLRSRRVRVPRPISLPAPEVVDAAERRLDVSFHPDYRRYLLEASDVTQGTLEPFVLTLPDSHIDLLARVPEAWAAGVPRPLLPICEDNGDYYCLDSAGRVTYWSHDGTTSESWPNLATWILNLWIR